MKKVIKTMMMMLVASAFVLTSCKDDKEAENVNLTINPSAASGTHTVGDTLKLVINAKGNSDNKLKNLTITKAPTGKPTETLVNEPLSGTDKIYDFTDILTLADTGAITYTIKLDGEKGEAQTITYLANVVKAGGLYVHKQNIELNAQSVTDGNHFLKLSGNLNRYQINITADEWKEHVDLIYYYGNTNKQTIASPANTTAQSLYSGLSGHFSNSRATGFYRLPSTEKAIYETLALDESTDKGLIYYAEGKTYSEDITELTNGDVILYKTKEGTLGMIKIFATSGTSNTNGNLQFQLLYQFN